ncbi:MAG: SDR family oxidoreductase [Planctomycetota bacterium]
MSDTPHTSHASLSGQNAIVTGGAKNLGGLLSRQLAARGANVAVHYHSDGSRAAAEETKAAIEAAGARAILFQADLTVPGNNAKLFEAATEAFGGVDIAINTTGMVLKKPLTEVTEDEYDTMFAINSKAAFFFMQQAGKHLNERGRLCTVVTSLLAAFTGYYSAYAGAKAPVEHFTRAASKEFSGKGISVTAVAPGPMDTPFFYGQETDEAVKYLSSAADLSKFSRTGLTDIQDIVPLIVFLVSEGWWITGQTIFANGGFTTR